MTSKVLHSSPYSIIDPLDFILEPSQISTLSCASIQSDFKFIVDGKIYNTNKNIARTIFTKVNDQLIQNPDMNQIIINNIKDTNCYFQLIQNMMAGEVITINENNAFFLNYIATTLGNDELKSVTNIFMVRYERSTNNFDENDNNNNVIEGKIIPAKWYQILIQIFLNFCSKLSIIFRIFLFLCELIGFAIGLAYIFNLFMIPLTSGFISLNLKKVYRYGLMIPYFLFNINISSLVEIIAFYICKSNHFTNNIPFSKHIQLIKLIKNIWPFCNKEKRISFNSLDISQSSLIDTTIDMPESQQNYISNKENEKKSLTCRFFFTENHNLYNTILGFLLIILCISFCFKNVFRFVIVLFSVLLPSFLIRALFILYAILAWISLFKKGRDNFIQFGDFSDPFVNSMFFSESKWFLFLSKCKRLMKRSNQENIEAYSFSCYEEENDTEDDEIYDKLDLFPFCCFYKCNSLFVSFVQAVFSKETAGFLVSVGILILLFDEWNRFNIWQIFLIVVVLILGFNVLMCSINFPFLLVNRFFTPSCSEKQIQLKKNRMNNSKKRVRWIELWFTWSKEATPIRVSRIIFLSFFILAIIGSIFPALLLSQKVISPNDSTDLKRATEIYRRKSIQSNQSTIYLKNPVCNIRIRDLNIVQLAALAESSYQLKNDDPTLFIVLRDFFGEDWNKTLQIVDDIPKSSASNSFMRHYVYKNNLHIISIRGTDDTIDVLVDLQMWTSSFMMNILSSSIPIFNEYFSQFRTFLGYLMHLPTYYLKPFSLVNSYIEIIKSFAETIPLVNGTEIILTGHSLGGGLAKLISTTTGYQAVSYSGPGIQSIAAFIGWKHENIPQSFINIVPNLDPIPSVDQTTGSSFLIPCNEGLFACHNMVRTMCMLSTLCTNNLTMQAYSFCLKNLGEKSMEEMNLIGKPYSYNS